MASSTVRQTVTTIQQSRSGGATSPILDNNLDALLEDLQTSVSRPSSAMNGMTSGSTGAQIYREVTTRTVQQQDKSPANRDVQVQYLSAANPTTFVSERAASPGMVELLQQQQQQQQQQPLVGGDQRAMAYKTVSYQYNTSSNTSGAPITGLVVDGTPVRSTSPAVVDTASDARLQQNLNELDSLLVDLHHAQKTGFGTDQAGPVHGGAVTTTTRTITGVDPGLLEPIDHSTPTPPTRQQIQQITRTVQQRTYVDGGGSSPSPARYSTEAQSSPRLQPKRSSSANRELTYGTVETQHRTRSPSPSPRVPQRAVVQKDTYYETKNTTTPKQERYRDKSPTNRRLQRELYYESKSSAVPPSPRQDRYRDPSPPAHRRGTSPMQYPSQPAPEVYPSQPGGSSKVTTIRTYNYSTSGQPAPSPVPPVSRSPYPSSGAPSPAPVVVELPHRSPSPYGTPQGTTTTYDSPSGTKVTTTVRTYTYELPGQPGSNQPYPPNHDPNRPPVYDPNDFGPVDRTLTYQVSPPPPREKEPLLEHPQQTPPPTVITYKYSSHSSHSTSSKFPQHPEEQQPLLPRPFPTPSPTPVSTVDGQPPKRLDELMASFSDTEIQHREPHPPVGYYVTEKHPANARPQHPEAVNGVALPPANVQASAGAGASANASAAANAKDRPKTKNVAGPPVYYPPGVELFARKEESMMAGKKASGRYEYEYESKSKSKSSSSGGAAVVPVCLPLCCAMPCVIL